MRAMASRMVSSLKSHPFLIASSVLLLFALPIFRMLLFFWPLIVSTVLGVLAVVSFGRTADDHDTLPCVPESALQVDSALAFSSHEGKISNVLMVGNREVTWLEWLHNEDTQKLSIHEREPALWDADADECGTILMQKEAVSKLGPSSRAFSDASSGKHVRVPDDAPPLPPVGEDIPSVSGLPGDEQMALDSTKEVKPTDVALDATKASDFLPPVLTDLNRKTGTMKASTAEEKTNSGGSGCVQVLETPLSVSGAISHPEKRKIACTHEQEAPDTALPNENVLPSPEAKDPHVCGVQGGTDEKNEKKGSTVQVGPQWDLSDGEEEGGGLHFSFFHNSSHTPSKP